MSGSVPTGPSELYLKLLKGEISVEEYAKCAKKRAQDDARQSPSGSIVAKAQRS